MIAALAVSARENDLLETRMETWQLSCISQQSIPRLSGDSALIDPNKSPVYVRWS